MNNLLLLISLTLIQFSCTQTGKVEKYMEIGGETMGTYYRIIYGASENYPDKEVIDAWLLELNNSLSTYVGNSVISRFNRSEGGIKASELDDSLLSKYFFENVSISNVIYAESDGFFDPTVMPLVNYWGFGYDHSQKLTQIDTHIVDSLSQFVGLNKLTINADPSPEIIKKDHRMELDFSAVAKGYAIDVVSQMLEDSFSIFNYLVDIGGESRARGVNSEGKIWRIGISEPVENSPFSSYKFIVELKDKAIATSGNYRNFYESNGQKISHTMNPKTGFFERNDLLSASILTDDCGYADGYATACMAMGFELAKNMVEKNEKLGAIFIYIDRDNRIKHYISPHIRAFVTPSN